MASCSHFKLSLQSNVKYFKFKLKLTNCFYQGWFRKDPKHKFRTSATAKLLSLFLLNRHAAASTTSKHLNFFNYWQIRCVGQVRIKQIMVRFNGNIFKETFLQGAKALISPVDRCSSGMNKEIQSVAETRKGHPSEAAQISRTTPEFKRFVRFWSKHCGDPMVTNSRSLLSEGLALMQLAIPRVHFFLACFAAILVVGGFSLSTLQFGKESNFRSVWSWEGIINALVPAPREDFNSNLLHK
ncbi:hypothetical protein O6H91_02G068000 [Diphasiastrum complanatum]|uniref:Uncharacterized protein n=2 Tax=Diphasiastrum complanatum TaxID=34168 RepID=A0ACC2EGQ6_DIPCM|nr:hypothetical protein O6H91_02G068000 [Diphasiastrum complanatum]KAJ7565627.1 hypothetical protein O6H91_02G068000 [Diphasiastrum complanatum]